MPFCFLFQDQLGNAEDMLKDFNVRCTQEMTMRENEVPVLRGGPGFYKVVKTGPSGHNIRSCPNLRGIPIGMLVLGNKVKAVGEVWTCDLSDTAFVMQMPKQSTI